MLDISIRELMHKKLKLEKEITEAIKGPIIKFQKETGIGIESIDIDMVCASWQEGEPKYLVGKITAKLDLGFIEALDGVNETYYIDKEDEKDAKPKLA